MPTVVITAQVKDAAKWEASFRTHGDIFRSYSIRKPIRLTTSGNDVVICMEPEDIGAFTASLESPETIGAMEADGVMRETVKVSVLDREMAL